VAFVVNDIRNLPLSIWKASTGQELKYCYDTEGKRIRKDIGSMTEYYVNGVGGETEAIVKYDETSATHSILGVDNLGQIKRTGSTFARYYYLKDHLGTIKMTVDAAGNTTGYDDYYPFGMQMDGRCNSSSADARYKFTSKERDTESGYDYFGARYYDARVGRWLSVDALAIEYPSLAPYVYAVANPLLYLDPNGLWTDPVNNPTYRGWYGNAWAPEKSKFGTGVRLGGTQNHQGVDLVAGVGTSLSAVLNGKIANVFDHKKFGRTVMLESRDETGNTVYFQYSHLSESSVKKGDLVKEGDSIGKAGQTGNAAGQSKDEAHVHFSVSTMRVPHRAIETYKDPSAFMKISTPEKPSEQKPNEPKVVEKKKTKEGNS
jgi:RHS repeat-associated protein